MKGYWVLAAVVALVAWDGWRGDLPGAPEATSVPPRTAAALDLPGSSVPQRPDRDPFRFGPERQAVPRAPDPEPSRSRELAGDGAAPPELPPPIRLIGFIRQAGELRAALSVLGRIALLSEGEAVEGYQLVAAEQDVGVRILDPDGGELELRLPPR